MVQAVRPPIKSSFINSSCLHKATSFINFIDWDKVLMPLAEACSAKGQKIATAGKSLKEQGLLASANLKMYLHVHQQKRHCKIKSPKTLFFNKLFFPNDYSNYNYIKKKIECAFRLLHIIQYNSLNILSIILRGFF